MGFILMAGGAFRVSFTQLVSQLEQSEREILKLRWEAKTRVSNFAPGGTILHGADDSIRIGLSDER